MMENDELQNLILSQAARKALEEEDTPDDTAEIFGETLDSYAAENLDRPMDSAARNFTGVPVNDWMRHDFMNRDAKGNHLFSDEDFAELDKEFSAEDAALYGGMDCNPDSESGRPSNTAFEGAKLDHRLPINGPDQSSRGIQKPVRQKALARKPLNGQKRRMGDFAEEQEESKDDFAFDF